MPPDASQPDPTPPVHPGQADPEGYVKGNSVVQSAPLVPEIKLHLADERIRPFRKVLRAVVEIGLAPDAGCAYQYKYDQEDDA
mgnify:CR=1 FL=1